ncbi:hypothetical protein H4217_001861 [Coemansia sp. RSA 1939]|nr:hypothetical protein H4217_001861 [Coemansia sp. RSA 1939]KAJ2616815.1 hypothetical protein EV177_000877 [Coemansia sp. RSA 1804]
MRSSPCIVLALAGIAVAANQIIHHNGACHLYRRQDNNNYMPQDDSGNTGGGGGNADAMYPYGSGNSDPYANDNLQYPDQYGSGSPFPSNYNNNNILPQQQYNGNSLQQPSNNNYYVPAQNTAAGYPQDLSGNNAPYPSQQQQQPVANPAPTSPAQETGSATQTQSIPSTIFDDLPGFLGITFPNQFQTTSYSTSMSDASDSHSQFDTQNGSGSDAENSAASASSDQSNSAGNLSTSNAPAAQLDAVLAIILALITYLV